MKLKCKHIKKIPLIASLAFLVGCTTAPEPKVFTSDTDKYAYVKEYMRWFIQKQMDDNEIMGLSVALVDDQKIVWAEGFGYANKAKGIKATPQTRYRAGSITKLFTAMATMKLAEEGKVDIDKPLKRYLPAFSVKSRFGSTDGVTPRNIMTHHSGLPSEWLDRMFATNPLMYTELVDEIKNEYVAYKPNTIFSYSNLGVSLLGHAVEKVSGMSYVDYVDKTLLTPLGMNHSDLNIALTGDRASKSYRKNEEIIEYADGQVPAGALNTTVGNLSHLIMMVNAEGKFNNKQVLSPNTLNQMFKVQNQELALDLGRKIGLGWFVDTGLLSNNTPVYGHGGAMVGHRAYVHVEPKSKLGIVIMANSASTNVSEIADTFMQKVWEAKTSLQIDKKEQARQEPSDFSGVYATMLGKVKIEKISDSQYLAHTNEGDFSLNKHENNLYKAKYKLLGLIPISNDNLEDISFYTKTIEGHELILINKNNKNMLGGTKVKQHTIPPTWKEYVGHYEVLNNFEDEAWKITSVEFKLEGGYVTVTTKFKSGETSTTMLKPINDTEAIIEGLGRSMQETIYVKDGIFHAQGLRFKKIEEKNND